MIASEVTSSDFWFDVDLLFAIPADFVSADVVEAEEESGFVAGAVFSFWQPVTNSSPAASNAAWRNDMRFITWPFWVTDLLVYCSQVGQGSERVERNLFRFLLACVVVARLIGLRECK